MDVRLFLRGATVDDESDRWLLTWKQSLARIERDMQDTQHTIDKIHALATKLMVRSGILPPRLLFQTRIILRHGLLQKVTSIKIEELSVGELSEFVINAEIFLLLGGQVVGGWECIEIGEILGDVWCLATFVAVHGSHVQLMVLVIGVCRMEEKNCLKDGKYARKGGEKRSEGEV